MTNKKNKIIPIFFLIIIILSVIYTVYNKRGCEKLDCLSSAYLDGYKLSEIYRDEKDMFSALYRKNDDLLRVEIVSELSQNEAEKIIDSKIIGIKAQFENRRSPYPGEISDEIICSNKFKPVFRDGYIIAYLNSRLAYGSCIEEENVYKSIGTWKYCVSQNKLYQLEFISPKERFKENKLEISCLD